MIGVHFSKDFAGKVLEAIQTGKPIPAPPGGWSGSHMLMLAGILYAAVFSQGPSAWQLRGEDLQKVKASMHPEKQEAVEETFHQDIHDGIEFLSTLTFKLLDGDYDAELEPEAKAVLYTKADGTKTFIPGEGFKGIS